MSDFLRWLLRPLWRFWVEPIRAEPVAAFRIAVGLVVLACLATSFGPRLPIDLGPQGLTPAHDPDQPYDPEKPGSLDTWLETKGRFCVLRGFIGVPGVGWVDRKSLGDFVPWCEDGGYWWFFAACVVATLFLIVGFLTRLATLVAFLLLVSFENRLPWVLNGGDAVMVHALFYLLLMPAGAVWSVDAWLRGRLWGKQPGPVMIEPWAVRLAMIQLATIYFYTGLVKLNGLFDDPQAHWEHLWAHGWIDQDWLNGEAVYWVLNDNALNRVPYYWLPMPMKICRLLSWGTLVFEIGFPLFVLFRSLRPWLLVGGVLFHLGIWFHTEVGFFSPIMLAWYPLFLSGATLAWLVGRPDPGPTPVPAEDPREPS